MSAEGRQVVAAVDVGGSKYVCGLVTSEGEILCSTRHEWDSRRQEDIVDQLAAAVEDEFAEHPELACEAIAGGLTIPGFADPTTGMWIDSDYPVVRNLDVSQLLSERLGMPFYADNDCNACVLAEARFGSCRGVDTFLYLTVSSGIGGGIYLGDKLYYGEHLLAGEIGLTRIDREPRPDISGAAFGRLEAYGCTRGMARTYAALADHPVDEDKTDGLAIRAAADAGDVAAAETIRREGVALGRAIANADALLAPKRVVIGGGLSLMFDAYGESLKRELHRIRPQSQAVVEPSRLGYNGAFLGAAACALRGIESEGQVRPQGVGEGASLSVSVGSSGIACCSLVMGGSDLLAAPGAGELSGMLVAEGTWDAGRSLAEALREDDSSVRDEALWRCIAFARTLLDPAEVRVCFS